MAEQDAASPESQDNSSIDISNVDNNASPEPQDNSTTETSWLNDLSDEYRTHPKISQFKSVEDMAKSYMNMEKSFGNRVPMPSEDWDESQYNDFYNKLGRPESPDGYEFGKAEGLPEDFEINEQFMKDFANTAHQSGMTKAQAQKAWNMLQQKTYESQKNAYDSYQQSLKERNDALKQEWGGEYDSNIAAAKKLMNLAGEEWIEYLKKSGLGQEPEFIKVSAKLGKMIGEDNIKPTKQSSATVTPAQADEQISKIWSENHDILMDKMHPERPALMKKLHELNSIADS